MKTTTTLKSKYFDLMRQGKTQAECETILGISHGVAKVYSCHYRKTLNGGIKTVKPKTIETVHEIPSHIDKPYISSIPSVENSTMKDFIPQRDGYLPRKLIGDFTDLEVLENFYKTKSPVLIIGDTGTGKTHAVRHFCFVNKLPYKRVNLNGGTTAEDLVGQYVPDGKGGFKWIDGWLTKFARDGGVICLDEVNGCPAEILFALHSITDDERTLTLTAKDGETVHAHKDLWVVATMNPDYEGCKPLNIAFKDRFRPLIWDYDTKIERKLGIPSDILNIAEKLRKSFRKGDLKSPVSTRALLYYVEDLKTFGKDGAREMFINRFDPEDRIVVEEVMKLSENETK